MEDLQITSIEKLKEIHEKIRDILIGYDCEEGGDCIIDEICIAFGIETTVFYYNEDKEVFSFFFSPPILYNPNK